MLSKEEINAISAAYLEVVTEKEKMVCKDCGDEFGKPTNEECEYDSADPQGVNWIKQGASDGKEPVDEATKAEMEKKKKKGLKADDEDPSDDDSKDDDDDDDDDEQEEDASNDKSDDGEGMDKVDPKAAAKKFKDRKDKDIDNDGDTDSTDKYLHKRRKAIGKSMKGDDDVEEGRRGFVAAAKAAKEKGEKTFVFAGKKYNCEDMKEVKKESYTFNQLVDMADEDFDDLLERIDRKEMDEIVGTVARGIGRLAKKAVVNKQGNFRLSTAGRADAAQAKAAKLKKKSADIDRLRKAKSDIKTAKADIKNKKANPPSSAPAKPAPKKPVTASTQKENTMKSFKKIREDAAHTKGATKPEGMHDKESKKSKEFRDAHKTETNDTEEKGHKDAADAGRKGPAGKKRAGDNPKGDKNIINKPTETK